MLNTVERNKNGTNTSLCTHDVEGNEAQDIKEYQEINMRLWDCNIEMDDKETSFVFRLNYSLQNWAKRGFWKS